MSKKSLLTVRLDESLIVGLMAAAKTRHKDMSELVRDFAVETIERAKEKNELLFEDKLKEANIERAERRQARSPAHRGLARDNPKARNVQPRKGLVMSTGKGKAPDEQDIRKGKSDIRQARRIAKERERTKRHK
jgi:hypothetical protein